MNHLTGDNIVGRCFGFCRVNNRTAARARMKELDGDPRSTGGFDAALSDDGGTTLTHYGFNRVFTDDERSAIREAAAQVPFLAVYFSDERYTDAQGHQVPWTYEAARDDAGLSSYAPPE